MAIEWLAGNRLRGTTAERPNASLPSGSVGGWVEVGRTTLGSSGDDIDVTSLPDKRYYHVLINPIPTGSINSNLHLNGSSTGYAQRHNVNGSGETALANRAYWDVAGTETNPFFSSMYIANLSGKEKLAIHHSVEVTTSGAGTAPERSEYVQKWVTSDVINRMNLNNLGTGSFDTNSEVVVLGYDPDDTHTTNFWEELADTTFTSSGVSAQTFTAKKYIWCQFWFTSDASGNGQHFQLGDTGGIDTGSTYARRFSINGGADITSASQSKIYFAPQTGAVTHFVNMFIVNNASNEKLVIINATTNNGSGAGNAPQRRETVGKWVETTNQCDRITIATDAGTFTGGQLKVWGAD